MKTIKSVVYVLDCGHQLQDFRAPDFYPTGEKHYRVGDRLPCEQCRRAEWNRAVSQAAFPTPVLRDLLAVITELTACVWQTMSGPNPDVENRVRKIMEILERLK